MKYRVLVNEEAVPLDPIGHLLYKAILPNLGEVAALPSIWKQTQGCCQNENKKRHGPNKRAEQNPRKITKL